MAMAPRCAIMVPGVGSGGAIPSSSSGVPSSSEDGFASANNTEAAGTEDHTGEAEEEEEGRRLAALAKGLTSRAITTAIKEAGRSTSPSQSSWPA